MASPKERKAMLQRLLAVFVLVVAAAGCGEPSHSSDACTAGFEWYGGCHAGASQGDWETRCQATAAACSDALKSELADYYACLADKDICTQAALLTSGCLDDVSLEALNCAEEIE